MARGGRADGKEEAVGSEWAAAAFKVTSPLPYEWRPPPAR